MNGAFRIPRARSSSPALLLVDDDTMFCSVLSRALAKRGFEVLLAHDVSQGMSIAGEHRPRYAVVDLCIGPASGLYLVEHLASLSPATRTVVLTGYASIATAVEAIKLGAIHYLTKPAEPDEIVAALHRDEGDAGVSIAERPLSVKRLEWEHLQKVLSEHQGNISASARALGMHRRTLQRKLRKRPVKQ
jgi:two-component system response regulator RegA